MRKIFIKKLKGYSIIIRNSNTMPLCFTAQQANSTIQLNGDWQPSSSDPYASNPYCSECITYRVNLEYKLEGSTTQDWERYTGQTITLANVNDKMYMRATSKGNESISNGGNNYRFNMTGKIAASGNIQTLLDQTGNKMDVPEFCYVSMFSGCTSLTKAPELPATTMANYCYQNMFRNCTSLTSAPELPATTLANYCYYDMFNNCPLFSTVKMKASMSGVYDTSIHGHIGKTVEYVL